MNNTSDQVISIEYHDDKVFLRLAAGREIGNPLKWHPWLEKATQVQRNNVESYELSAYWPDLDDGLDVEEMMKGMPPHVGHQQVKVIS
jgi:hypothetical protein